MWTLSVNKSGSSNYRQTLLYFISIREESNQIVLNKNGPVYSVEWNPARDESRLEFIVLYGFMPCKDFVRWTEPTYTLLLGCPLKDRLSVEGDLTVRLLSTSTYTPLSEARNQTAVESSNHQKLTKTWRTYNYKIPPWTTCRARAKTGFSSFWPTTN